MNIPSSYELKRVLGSGCFGTSSFTEGYVFEGLNTKTQEIVAIKRIQKVGNQLSRELEILTIIKECQNVVTMKEFFYSRNFENKLIQNIVFQFAEDNLENLIERHIRAERIISEKVVKNYIYQLLNGLKQIHKMNIAHRDLKPENVLLTKKGIIKICDFGSSKILDKNGKNTPYIVSRYYRAPELIMCVTSYDLSIDIWAAACILAEMFMMEPIFKGKTEGDQLLAIMKILGNFTERENKEFEQRVPFNLKILDKFQTYEKKDLKEIFPQVEDLENLSDLLGKMLRYLPEDRITAEQALKHPFFHKIHEKKSVHFSKKQIEPEKTSIS